MARYIDADKLTLDVQRYLMPNDDGVTAIENAERFFIKLIRQQPTADVVEVKYGEWIEWWDDNYLCYCHKCSECGSYPLTKEETMRDEVLSFYCPNCGAKMDGERKDDNDSTRNDKCFDEIPNR